MLTKREREWLADSEKWNFKRDIYGISCFCPSCNHCEYVTETANGVFCQDAEDMWLYDKLSKCPLVPSKELLLEAAEFEARVAEKLALGCDSQTPCNGCWRANWKFCNLRKGYWDCADCFLKVARLAVEEEMYADE